MELTILGSGTGLIRKERYAPSFLLRVNGKLILIDCGWGTPVRLAELEINEQDIDHIVISHTHADHSTTLMNVMQSMLIRLHYNGQKREKPLYIHGPKGIQELYDNDRRTRFPEPTDFPVYVLEYQEEKREIEGITFSALPVHHVTFFNSVSFKIESEGESLYYSGDMGYSDTVGTFVRGCDTALLEMCITPEYYEEAGPRPNHLSPLECGMIAGQSEVDRLVLWHLYDNVTEEEALQEIRKQYAGDVIFSKDLQKITW